MNIDPCAELIARIDAWQARHRVTDNKLSLALSRDHRLIRRIRERQTSARTMQRVAEFIARDEWPQ